MLTRDVHDLRYDAIHDEFFVTNSSAEAILAFRGGATGEEAPVRIIQGPHTQLVGAGTGSLLDRLEVDAVHNEIFVPTGSSILVFPRDGNGDVPPIRAISGPDTELSAVAVAVDPIHNLIVAGNSPNAWEVLNGKAIAPRFVQKGGLGSLVMFNRTDNGNVKPRAVIQGPKTRLNRLNQMQIYAPKGWILVSHPGTIGVYKPDDGFIGIWSINDNGDVPARWLLKGPKSTLMKPRGVAFDAKHKEVIVADMRLNAVLTFYFPELF